MAQHRIVVRGLITKRRNITISGLVDLMILKGMMKGMGARASETELTKQAKYPSDPNRRWNQTNHPVIGTLVHNQLRGLTCFVMRMLEI